MSDDKWLCRRCNEFFDTRDAQESHYCPGVHKGEINELKAQLAAANDTIKALREANEKMQEVIGDELNGYYLDYGAYLQEGGDPDKWESLPWVRKFEQALKDLGQEER